GCPPDPTADSLADSGTDRGGDDGDQGRDTRSTRQGRVGDVGGGPGRRRPRVGRRGRRRRHGRDAGGRRRGRGRRHAPPGGETGGHACARELVAEVDAGGPIEPLSAAGAEVVIAFTHPDVVMGNLEYCVTHGIHAVVGTTGFTDERLATLRDLLGSSPDTGV